MVRNVKHLKTGDLTYNGAFARHGTLVGEGFVQEKLARLVQRAALPDGGAGSVQRRNRERRIREILLAATEIFRVEGYAGFTTRKVAVKAGLTLSNLQYYFPDKNELLAAIIKNFLQGFLDDYAELAHRNGVSSQRRCAALVDRIFEDIGKADVVKFMFEIWAYAQHESYASDLVAACYTAYRSIFASLLADINPLLPPDERDARALVLTAQAEGMMIMAARGIDSQKDFDTLASMTKRSIKAVAGLSGDLFDAVRVDSQAFSTEAEVGLGVFDGNLMLEHQVNANRYDLSVACGVAAELGYLRPTMQTVKREVKVREIISAAAQVLASEGYANFTLARVAEVAGVRTSGLQHYFPTHEDLLGSTIHAIFSGYSGRWAAMSQPSDKPVLTRLFEVIDEVFVEACDPRVCRFSFEMFALAERSEMADHMLSKSYNVYRQMYVNLVREIDPTAGERECLARGTLIAAQTEGLIVYTYSTGRETPGLDRVLGLFKAIAVEIATGFPRSKGTESRLGV